MTQRAQKNCADVGFYTLVSAGLFSSIELWRVLLLTGVYTTESLTDCSWLCMALGLIFVYHFVILQGLGLVRLHSASISISLSIVKLNF